MVQLQDYTTCVQLLVGSNSRKFNGEVRKSIVLQGFKGWMTRQIFLADQNQHVSKPTWVKLQCNRHSRSALKSVLKMAKLALSEKTFLKGRSLIGHLYDV